MKIHSKQIPKGTLNLLISMILVAVSSMLIAANLQEKTALEKSVRGYYSENYVKMSSGAAGWNDFADALSNRNVNNVIIYKERLESLTDTRGVYYKGKIEKPPLLSGRFFEESDFSGNQKVALIGGNYLRETVTREGIQYITILEEEFEVIGVLGSGQVSRLDTMLWIPLDVAVSLTGTEGTYYIDGASAGAVEENVTALQSVLQPDIDFYYDSNNELVTNEESSGFQMPDTVTMIYLAIVFTFILTTVFTTAGWISNRRQMIQVARSQGFRNREILLSVYGRFLPIPFLAALAAYVTLSFISLLRGTAIPRWTDLIAAFLVLFLSATVIVASYLVKELRSKKIYLVR